MTFREVLAPWVADALGVNSVNEVPEGIWDYFEKAPSLEAWLADMLQVEPGEYFIYEAIAQLEEMFDISLHEDMIQGPLAEVVTLIKGTENFNFVVTKKED